MNDLQDLLVVNEFTEDEKQKQIKMNKEEMYAHLLTNSLGKNLTLAMQ